jgi:hypothetical protein
LPFFLAAFILVSAAACGGKPGESAPEAIKPEGNPAPDGVGEEPAELFTYKYDEANEGICLTRYSGTKTKLKIPEEIDGSPVVGIGAFCFEAGTVTAVYFDKALKYFEWGGNTSSALKNASQTTIPFGVTDVANAAFYKCESLTSATLPDGVKTIGGSAFYSCASLKSVTLPEGLTAIGRSAFAWCSSLKNINIPDSVTEIGDHAFQYCGSLTSAAKEKIRRINPDALD